MSLVLLGGVFLLSGREGFLASFRQERKGEEKGTGQVPWDVGEGEKG